MASLILQAEEFLQPSEKGVSGLPLRRPVDAFALPSMVLYCAHTGLSSKGYGAGYGAWISGHSSMDPLGPHGPFELATPMGHSTLDGQGKQASPGQKHASSGLQAYPSMDRPNHKPKPLPHTYYAPGVTYLVFHLAAKNLNKICLRIQNIVFEAASGEGGMHTTLANAILLRRVV